MSIPAIIFCIILGAGSFYMYQGMRSDNKIVAAWSKTNGRILKTEVTRARSPMLLLEYEYYIDGVRYQSNKVYRQDSQYSLGSPYDLDKLEFLKNPEVKYNPLNPSECCLLIYDRTWVFVLSLIAGIILSLFGWIGLLVKIFK
jgi:hypothetical protein